MSSVPLGPSRPHRPDPRARVAPDAAGLLLFALAALAYGPTASAYLDPGTGSILLQGLLALLATVGAFFGTIRQHLRQWFGGASRSKAAEPSPQDRTPDP